jgi:TPP-dependent pyruvate/acetoin dehydrogenase alpha subunit
MLLNRRLEERLANLYRQGKVVGGLYLSLGQEATSVASAFALEPQDLLAPMIRNLGSMLVRGVKPREVLMQYMAKADGPSGGRDGNLHFGGVERGLIAPSSMVGALVPVMAGVALASRMRKLDAVALTYVGDGATSTGAFHEGMNFASVQKLPLVVIGEDNRFAYSTPVSKQMAIATLADRAKAYAMAAVTVDGNDAEAVYTATKLAVERARAGGGPTFIEAKTMRMRGHAEHDDGRYVPRELLEEWRAKDPIDRYRAFLSEKEHVSAADLHAIEERIRAELDEEVARAEASPEPPAERGLGCVYAEDPRPFGGPSGHGGS